MPGTAVRDVCRFLIAIVLASAWHGASAQESQPLEGVPRYALVIGNSRYADAPLKNPRNDAEAIAAELRKMGFNVRTRLDVTRAELVSAIAEFGADLQKTRGIGLFYYAGHGAQLSWRNYLIPVDAVIEQLSDLPARAVALDALLTALSRAKNRMNVIILDACRDNPFGTRARVDEKGLSQFDAPPGSLLAYATSPGNVASDGGGVNGLYTESLLREMRVAESKIEDVMKRVRLNVRQRSQGQQVPWETTSLEEDFYFLPPKRSRLTREEADRQFEQELAIWQKIKDARDPAAFEDYLRRFPTGKFSEVAQFRLDRLLVERGEKGVQIASIKATPFSQGTARVDTRFRVGDIYRYRETDLSTGAVLRNLAYRVTDITDNEIVFNEGRLITDYLGNAIKTGLGWEYIQAQFFIAEYSVGKRWTTRFRIRTAPDRPWTDTDYAFKVVGRERIEVPAGTFDAYRVEGRGINIQSGTDMQWTYWIAPEVRRVVAQELKRTRANGAVVNNERLELTAYLQQ